MRWAFLSAGLAAAMVSPSVLTQESLCNPCVDPPSLHEFSSTNATVTVTVTAEDMRKLGVVAVSDLVNKLPQSSAEKEVPNSEEAESSSDDEGEATSEADSQPSDE